MPSDLGEFITSEVSGAEATMAAAQARGQAVLTVSGALVTLLAGVLALAAGKDTHVDLSPALVVATLASLSGFVGATVLVLLMHLPPQVVAISLDEARTLVQDHWADEGWDQRVAEFRAEYFGSLRAANEHLLGLLYKAVIAEVVGIAGIAFLAVTILFQAL